MIAHDCTRQYEVVSFIECQNPDVNSGWALDRYFTDRRTRAEVLEVRKYSKASVLPLLYTGACLPPNLIQAPAESLTVQELKWPTIKAETKITGCDVDERRILPDGTVIPVGMERFNEALNWGMMGLIDGLRATHISEAITLLKTGGYILHDSANSNIGTVDFGRATELSSIDLSGTNDDFSEVCSRPFDVIEALVREMARCGGASGVVDVIYGPKAWEAVTAHEVKDSIQYGQRPGTAFDRSFSSLLEPFMGYADVQFRGSTNGGTLNHWVSFAEYLDHEGNLVPMLAPGEILIVSAGAFGGQRIFRTVTSDGKEFLPEGALPYFLYDDMDREYNRKCRSFEPWIEEHHLFVPSNVNGAVLARVVADDAEICIPCVDCP